MNKTISINIGGLVFQIDENAYAKLEQYLTALKARFSDAEEREEIMADIEARLAELFQERIHNEKNVINLQDVEAVTSVMGDPEQIESDDAEETTTTASTSTEQERAKTSKRLYRNPDDKVVGGVASGVSAYLGIADPVWLRVLLVILVILGVGSPIIIYLIAWAIIPEAKTSSEKLQMRGENVTISNIEKNVKQSMSNLNTGSGGNFIARFFGLLGEALRLIFSVAGKVLGVAFLISGAILMVCWVLACLFPIYPGISGYFFVNQFQAVLGSVGSFLLLAIPTLGVMYLGLRLLDNKRFQIRGAIAGMASLWFLGLILSAAIAIMTVNQFSESATVTEREGLDYTDADTLFLKADLTDLEEGGNQLMFGDIGGVQLKDGIWTSYDAYLDIEPSESGELELHRILFAKGSSDAVAEDRAYNISSGFKQQDSILTFSDAMSFPKDDRWRAQKVTYVLKVPVGMAVILDPSLRSMLKPIDNVLNTSRSYMVGNTWIMTKNGLDCSNCDLGEGIVVAEDMMSFGNQDFDELEVNGKFNVELVQGEEYSIQLSGRQEDLERVQLKQNGEELEISYDKKWFQSSKTVGVVIQLPDLSQVDIAGAANLEIPYFEVNELEIEAAGATKLNIEVIANYLKLEIAGSSEASLYGSANQLELDVAGAASIDGRDLQCRTINVDIAGAGEATLFATETIKGSLTGASNLEYYGGATVDVSTSGASSVSEY